MKTSKFNLKEGINAKAHRKENNFTDAYQIIVHNNREGFKTPVEIRFYHTNAQSYACVWINDGKKGLHGCGSGKAGGYGYHRGSQAAQCAFLSAGIDFDTAIGGRGESAIVEALNAIAKHLEYKNYFVNHVHA